MTKTNMSKELDTGLGIAAIILALTFGMGACSALINAGIAERERALTERFIAERLIHESQK